METKKEKLKRKKEFLDSFRKNKEAQEFIIRPLQEKQASKIAELVSLNIAEQDFRQIQGIIMGIEIVFGILGYVVVGTKTTKTINLVE